MILSLYGDRNSLFFNTLSSKKCEVEGTIYSADSCKRELFKDKPGFAA